MSILDWLMRKTGPLRLWLATQVLRAAFKFAEMIGIEVTGTLKEDD